MLCGQRRTISLATREDNPGDAGGFVGDRDTDQSHRLALKQASHLGSRRRLVGVGAVHKRGGADDQKPAQIAIAHFRYPAETVFAAGEGLAWYQAKEGGKLSAIREDARIRHAGRQGRCRNDADPGAGLESLTGLVSPVPGQKFAFELPDLFGQIVELPGQALKGYMGDRR